jgi:undecaprenyl diphosphate synthase
MGHRAGAENLRRIIRAANAMEIGTLTLFAFSSNNWQRPEAEVNEILRLLKDHLIFETPECVANGIRISVIGRRDRLSEKLRAVIQETEQATAAGEELHLRLAVDYSSREMLYRAACRFYKSTEVSRASFEHVLGEVTHDETRDVDLVIRTGGEQRLSDYLLWESAYAELIFTRKMWPEFTEHDLHEAIAEFQMRIRTFGALPDEPDGDGIERRMLVN